MIRWNRTAAQSSAVTQVWSAYVKPKRKTVKAVCEICGAEFDARALDVAQGRGKTCSYKCNGRRAGQMTTPRLGTDNPSWKGGVSSGENEKAYRATYARSYRKTHQDREIVYGKTKAALQSGKLQRQPCSVCGGKAQAHHEDYTKPLDITWLCQTHHAARHREMRACATTKAAY